MSKALSPAVLVALKDALSKIYWYKKDLISFVEYAVENRNIVGSIDWQNNTKFESVSILVDRMNSRNDIYHKDIMSLLDAVLDFNDYSHFDRLEASDGAKHKIAAQSSVNSLRMHCQGYIKMQRDAAAATKARERFISRQNEVIGYNNKIEEFKNRYYDISRMESQKRGYELENFLNDLFAFFDLSPRKSFRIDGEQIDGAFTHDNTDYLLEAKWHNSPIERADIDIFSAVVGRKLKTTLGLFVSINGFVPALNSLQNNSIILMDSIDLMQVLENRIRLPELITLKRRHAAETGESMYRVTL